VSYVVVHPTVDRHNEWVSDRIDFFEIRVFCTCSMYYTVIFVDWFFHSGILIVRIIPLCISQRAVSFVYCFGQYVCCCSDWHFSMAAVVMAGFLYIRVHYISRYLYGFTGRYGVYLYQDTSSNSDKPLGCNCRYCLLHGWSVLSTSFFCNEKYINKCPKYHVKKWLFLQRWPQRFRARLTILTNFVTFTTRLEMKQV
jgi:hypothetical protein